MSPTSTAPGQSVNASKLLGEVRSLIRRYVVLGEHESLAVALWVLHTHLMEAANSTPILNLTSAEKRSGKTLLLETIELLVAQPWFTSRVTGAVLVRKLGMEPRPTLLLDESDAAFGGLKEYVEALRGVLNSGYRRGGKVSLLVSKGKDWVPVDFSIFGAKAIAGIGKLPDTAADRSIEIVLRRRASNELVRRFRREEATKKAEALRAHIEQWKATALPRLKKARPKVPDALDDRAAEIWEPLLAIADLARGDWPERAREAALALSTGEQRESESLGVVLLKDIQALFKQSGVDRLTSAEVVKALNSVLDAPWGDLHGKPIDERAMARMLRPYGVRPHQIRLGNTTQKGYLRSDFADAWKRYAP